MQSTSISVNKQTVRQFLEYGAQEPFVFPEYQRPYSWGIDHTDQLFEDLWNFTQNEGGLERENATYFLGCFVFYSTGKSLDTVDGQQRMTTLTLLLRALYTCLEAATPTKAILRRMELIAPVIWKQDKNEGDIDFSTPLIQSRAVDDKYNDIFHKILETGNVGEKADDNYSRNYLHLQQRIREKCEEGLGEPMLNFCWAVLNQCIVLPIRSDSQETAQIIFNTLNARGLALSDADIFKALIFGHLKDETEKKVFIDRWIQISNDAAEIGLTIQNLLSYYMFYLRGKEGDVNSTTVALGTYYKRNGYAQLYDPQLLDRLYEILLFLRLVVRREAIEGEDWSKDVEITRALDILRYYPNDYWRYPVLIYYMQYKHSDTFVSDFLAFLRKLTAELLKRFCVYPTLTAIKGHVLNLDRAIFKTQYPSIDFGIPIDDIKLELGIKQPSRGIRNMLLVILAYEKQDGMMPYSWEVEHIFPQSWKGDFAQRPEYSMVKEHMDDLGNYLPLEKKLNIRVSDGYFESKKPKYLESTIALVQEFGNKPKNDWKLEDIMERNAMLAVEIKEILKRWTE